MPKRRTKVEILANLQEVLSRFPTRLQEDETNYNELTHKGGFSIRVTVPSGTLLTDSLFSSKFLGQVIPCCIDDALENYKSIDEYILDMILSREDSPVLGLVSEATLEPVQLNTTEFKTKFKNFTPIPLVELPSTALNINYARREAYIRRRLVFSLTKICSLSPRVYFDNKDFITWLKLNPENKKSNFYRAIEIEPSILQTNLGIEMLKENISFWNKNETQRLAQALKTEHPNEKKGVLTSDTIREKLIQTLFMVKTFCPDAFELTDDELQQVLLKNGVIAKTLIETDFRKIRVEVHAKRRQG